MNPMSGSGTDRPFVAPQQFRLLSEWDFRRSRRRVGRRTFDQYSPSVSVPGHGDPPFREHGDPPFRLMATPRTGVATQPVEGVSGIVG